jgi:hypothetical protein
MITVAEGRSSYRILKIDGRPSKLTHDELKSAVGAAEFGTILRGIFAPDSGVNLRWTGKEKLRGRAVTVFSIDAPATSSVAIQDPARGGHQYHVIVAGEVFSDTETNAILRLHVRFTVPPKD